MRPYDEFMLVHAIASKKARRIEKAFLSSMPNVYVIRNFRIIRFIVHRIEFTGLCEIKDVYPSDRYYKQETISTLRWITNTHGINHHNAWFKGLLNDKEYALSLNDLMTHETACYLIRGRQ